MKLSSLLFFVVVTVLGQSNPTFLFPIRPGKQNFLSGNMGELRSNHFHAGLDIKTQQQTGLPVYASYDGVVSKVTVSSYGYGNVMYLKHPNGYTTVYAHLLKFYPAFADFVRGVQYQKRAFDINIENIHDSLFQVKRGDIIGWSGNSGSSGGPHLHFEIRDSIGNIIDPLEFGFPEITDNIPPYLMRFMVVPKSIDARVEGIFDTRQYSHTKSGNNYYLSQTVLVEGKVGVEINGYDRSNGTSNIYGIKKVMFYVDSTLIFARDLAHFTHETSSHINQHIDYDHFINTGIRFEKLYLDDGNTQDFYQHKNEKGIIELKDSKIHKGKIRLCDHFDNCTEVFFNIQNKHFEPPFIPSITTNPTVELRENILKITRKKTTSSQGYIQMSGKGMKFPIRPAYMDAAHEVYLWDMSQVLVDSVQFENSSLRLNYKAMVPSGKKTSYVDHNLEVQFEGNELFDTLYANSKITKNGFILNDNHTALADRIKFRLKVDTTIYQRSKTALYYKRGIGNYSYLETKWKADTLEAYSKYLGEYIVLTDTVAPSVRIIKFSSESLEFKISDNLSGIFKVDCFVGGQWVLMNYDHKWKYIWSEKLPDTPPFKGEVLLKVYDYMGNVGEFKTTL